MRFTKTSGLKGSFIEGDRLAKNPEKAANLSFSYTMKSGALQGVSLGALENYIEKRVSGWNNQVDASLPNGIFDKGIPLKGYTTIDISVGYEWKKISILCKPSNITNELKYIVHEKYSVNPIEPRQILTSLQYKF